MYSFTVREKQNESLYLKSRIISQKTETNILIMNVNKINT